MAIRSPSTGGKSLRDRIARFETVDVSTPKSPVSPRLKTGVNTGRIPTNGRSSDASVVTSQQDTSELKTPTVRSTAQISADDSDPTEIKKSPVVEIMPAAEVAKPNSNAPVAAVSSNTQPPAVVSVEESSSMQTISSEASSLDALLSPVASVSQEVYTREVVRDSAREEEETDVRFSTIPLSGKSFDEEGKCQPSFSSFSSGTPSIDDTVLMEQDPNPTAPLEDNANTSTVPHKSVNGQKKDSVSSLTSVPFMMNRLDKQEEMNDLTLGSNRQLQEEFSRIQKQKANADTEAEAQQIDWGWYVCR